jgi:RNA polymerase sigma factor (sigma-70 family)
MVPAASRRLKQRDTHSDGEDMATAVANVHARPALGARSHASTSTLASAAVLKTQSDARLCRLTSDGYEAAYEALVRRYRGPMHRYARRFLTDAFAEDVVQHAFMDLWATLSAGEQIHNVRAWLFRVVRNASLNTIRRAGYRHDELQEAPAFDSPEHAFERSAELRDALNGLASLPAQQREAIVRSAVDGDSRSEIGTAMGLSDGAVGQLLYRARSTLRCAMSAIVPLPVLAWLARARGYDPSPAARLLQITATGTNSGTASILLRGGATLAALAATAAPVVALRSQQHQSAVAVPAAVPVSADTLVAGAAEPMAPFPHRLAAPAPPEASHPPLPAPSPRVLPGPEASASEPAAPEGGAAEAEAAPAADTPPSAEATPPAEAAATPEAPAAEPAPPVEPEAAPAEPAPPLEPEAAPAEATPPPASEAPPE